MRYVIPHIPPSLNSFAGRKNVWEYRRKKAEWSSLMRLYLKPLPKEPLTRVELTLVYYFADRRRRDPDNRLKFILDGLKESGVIADDSFSCVRSLSVKCGEPDPSRPRIEIELKDCEEDL